MEKTFLRRTDGCPRRFLHSTARGNPVYAAERPALLKKMVKLNERVKRSQKVSTDRSIARRALTISPLAAAACALSLCIFCGLTLFSRRF